MGGDDQKPESGHVGNLESDQEDSLKEIWKKFFTLTKDKKPPMGGVSMDQGGDDGGDGGGGEGKEAFGGKETDDKAKDEQAKKNEKKELSAIMSKHGPDEFHKGFWQYVRGEDPDALMLRFLRARKWDVDRAFAMLAGALKFRLEFGVEEIKIKGEEGMCKEEGFQLQYDKGKAYIHGTDKSGRPIVFIHVAKHNPKEQSQKSLERFTIFNMETSKMLMAPPVEQGTLVFDMTNFGLSNMDWGCVAFIVKCFEAYYPETLGLCLIHKAPMVFNAIWKILRPMLDPVVRQKIDFTNSEADLMKHIDGKHLSKGMGGESSWKWRYDGPGENENEKWQDDKEGKEKAEKAWNEMIEEWEEVTKKWVDGDDSAGKERRGKLAKKFTIRDLDVDPYRRGMTVYSRTGVNIGNGQVHWKYPGADDETFGEDYDEVRKELGIEGECPRLQQEDEIEVSDSDEDEEDGPPPGGKVGAMAVGVKNKTTNSISKVTPGPSNSEKEKKRQDEKAARRKEKIEEKRKELEEQRKKEEEEKNKEDEDDSEEAVNKGYMAYLDSLKSGAGSVANGAASAPGKALEYVPHEIGTDALKVRLKNPPEGEGEGGGEEAKEEGGDKKEDDKEE